MERRGKALLDHRGNPIRLDTAREQLRPSWPVSRIQARYDASITTRETERYWAWTDATSAKFANSKDVRRTLRMRSRYEIANNSYAAGMISTLANDCIGTGPRLQMLTPDRILNRAIEEQFRIWSRAIRLPQKLRTM